MTLRSLVHILLVDDDEETREMLTMLFKSKLSGCRIATVDCAEDAAALIEEQSFDLYVLDYMLAGMTGVELCAQIRKGDKQTPIMIFTAMGDPYIRDRALEAGADAFLRKPRDLDDLLQTAEELIRYSE